MEHFESYGDNDTWISVFVDGSRLRIVDYEHPARLEHFGPDATAADIQRLALRARRDTTIDLAAADRVELDARPTGEVRIVAGATRVTFTFHHVTELERLVEALRKRLGLTPLAEAGPPDPGPVRKLSNLAFAVWNALRAAALVFGIPALALGACALFAQGQDPVKHPAVTFEVEPSADGCLDAAVVMLLLAVLLGVGHAVLAVGVWPVGAVLALVGAATLVFRTAHYLTIARAYDRYCFRFDRRDGGVG